MNKHHIIFLDCEFTGLQQHTSLISLALVAESGEEFYAEFTDSSKSPLDRLLIDINFGSFFKSLLNNCWVTQKLEINGIPQRFTSPVNKGLKTNGKIKNKN